MSLGSGVNLGHYESRIIFDMPILPRFGMASWLLYARGAALAGGFVAPPNAASFIRRRYMEDTDYGISFIEDASSCLAKSQGFGGTPPQHRDISSVSRWRSPQTTSAGSINTIVLTQNWEILIIDPHAVAKL